MRFSHLALATALVAFSGTAIAQPWHHHEGAGELTQGVTLSDAQQAQLKTIEETARTAAKPLMQQMHGVHEQILTQMLGSNAVTEADLAPLVQQEEGLRNQLDQIRLNAGLQIRGVMTAPQLAEAASRHQQLSALRQQEHQVMQSSSPAQ